MKFFVVFALIVAVASAGYIKPVLTSEQAEIQEIIAAIQSPSTNPATAAALEQMLLDVLGLTPTPVAVGPAIIEQEEPVSVGPAIIDFPLPEGGDLTPVFPEPPIVGPAIVGPAGVGPAVVGPSAPSAPLVQIILNINQAAAETSPVAPAPVAVPEPADVVEPVQIVDNWPVVVPVSPVDVVDVTPVVVDPVQVIEAAPVAIEPVIIGTPVIPAPAITLPDQLN